MNITLPLIISDFGDIEIFDSVDQAESYCEPDDINSLIGFDSQGRKLEFSTRKVVRRVLWFNTEVERVVIYVKEDRNYIEDLRNLLIEYLSRVKMVNRKIFLQRDWSQLHLPELIDTVKKASSRK